MRNENTITLHTQHLTLREFTADDCADFFEIMADREVNTFLPWFPVQSLAEAWAILERDYLAHYDRPSAYRYAICLKEQGGPIGYINVGDDDSHDFGYALKKEYWHRGIATEAAGAVIGELQRVGFNYITATHDVNNPSSGSVMKKIGMRYQYSYVEQWQPKDIAVTFRLYQLNLDGQDERTYMKYWDRYPDHFIEVGC